MKLQELKDRWKAQSPIFWKKTSIICYYVLGVITSSYITIAALEATGYYKAPGFLTYILSHLATWVIATLAVAKFTKMDINVDLSKGETDKEKLDIIDEVINTDNIKMKLE